MKTKNRNRCIALCVIFGVVVILGCGNKEEKNKDAASQVQSTSPESISKPLTETSEANTRDILVSVDGKYFKKSQLEKEIKELMDAYKDQIPKDKTKEIQANIKKQLIENFIIRTVLENEIEKRKIQAKDKEINESIEQIKAGLPPGQKFADFLKESRLTKEKFNENIAFTIKVKQLVQIDLGNKAKPSAKEISKFYNENKDKFVVPESVNVRHILVVIEEGDDEKIKAEKKAKIENLQK
jgi:peptidyl-prolyl cis-trans isomerase C